MKTDLRLWAAALREKAWIQMTARERDQEVRANKMVDRATIGPWGRALKMVSR